MSSSFVCLKAVLEAYEGIALVVAKKRRLGPSLRFLTSLSDCGNPSVEERRSGGDDSKFAKNLKLWFAPGMSHQHVDWGFPWRLHGVRQHAALGSGPGGHSVSCVSAAYQRVWRGERHAGIRIHWVSGGVLDNNTVTFFTDVFQGTWTWAVWAYSNLWGTHHHC
jgi:hypothetical protein